MKKIYLCETKSVCTAQYTRNRHNIVNQLFFNLAKQQKKVAGLGKWGLDKAQMGQKDCPNSCI